MKIVNLIPGTQEWLKWRRQGLGSSDAPVVLKKSPWSTPYKLWQEKLGLVPPPVANDAMKRGVELEPIARKFYEEKTGIEMPATLVEHEKISFLRASLDGLNKKIGLEIKCPGARSHAQTMQTKSIPEHYMWQLVHQMAAGNLDRVDYLSFDGKDGIIIPFERDLKLEKNLLAEETAFWDLVTHQIEPEVTESDFEVLSAMEMIELAREYQTLDREIKGLTERREAIKDQFQKQTKGRPTKCGGLLMQAVTRRGNVDYAKIPELKNVDLEKYRKSSIQSFRIDIQKVKK